MDRAQNIEIIMLCVQHYWCTTRYDQEMLIFVAISQSKCYNLAKSYQQVSHDVDNIFLNNLESITF